MAQVYSYNTTAALPCRSCGGGFKEADNVVLFHNRRFHARCYHCHQCKKQFEIPTADNSAGPDQPQEAKELPYCAGACHREASKELCGGCGDPLNPFVPFLRPKNLHKKYHKDCFKCTQCQQPMHTGFAVRWDHPYCPTCVNGKIQPPAGVKV